MPGYNDRSVDETSAGSTTVTTTREREESATRTVVEAVAEATGDDPTAMRPLYDVVDTDALDAVFEPTDGARATQTGRVSFRFNGCDVTVHADGRTVVSAPVDGA